MSGSPSAELIASVNRALWGEASDRLRCVRVARTGPDIVLRFIFVLPPEAVDLDSVSSVGGEVAADFPGSTVSEQVVTIAADRDLPDEQGWHTVFLRREPSPAD